MASIYRCSSCGVEFDLSEDGFVHKTCTCSAPVIAEATASMKGSGGVV